MLQVVSIIGLGYVGLPSAALIARAGHKALGVDVNETLVSELQSGHCRLDEADVREIVQTVLADGSLTASTQLQPSDIFVICVPTPVKVDKSADMTMVSAAIQSICTVLKKGDMVLLESTSPIGTTDNIIAHAVRNAGFDPLNDLDICHCPERVFPGNTINEIVKNNRLVGGFTPRAVERATAFYKTFCQGNIRHSSPSNVEFAKLMENTYRDVNIALSNVFSHIAEESSCDISDVISMANQHPRVNVHQPGPGVGGHCIPVDPWFLINGFPHVTDLLRTAREINDNQVKHFLNRAEDSGLSPKNGIVAVLGAAYRGDIDDARNTPTQKMIDILEARGYHYVVHDPQIRVLRLADGRSIDLLGNIQETLNGATAVFFMTAHSIYSNIALQDFALMRGQLIVDCCGVSKTSGLTSAGFTKICVGVPPQAPSSVNRLK